MKFPKCTVVLAAAFFSLASTGAKAATTITYTGIMSSGLDQTGALFAAGTDLTGKAFTATFYLDETTPGATVNETSTTQSLSGTGLSNPVHASLAIAGASTLYFGDTRGSSQLMDTGFDYVDTSANNTADLAASYSYENILLFLYNFTNAVSFFPNDVNYAVQPGDYGGGSFVLQTYSYLSSQNLRYVSGSFNIQNVSISEDVVPGVPEPATWVMMLLGFAAVGFAMRRARISQEFAEADC